MTTTQSNPAAARRPQCPPLTGDRMRTAAGSTSESRMAATLARLADMDALTRRGIAAWDALRGAR